MSHRYRAPEHTSGIFCPSGNEYRADEAGIIEIPAEAPEADHAAARGAGFELADEPAAADPPADTTSAKKAKPPAEPEA